MADPIVEYIGGIRVVRAFSQSAGSYRRYADAVNYNARYYVEWMRENQKTFCMRSALIPSGLVVVLPWASRSGRAAALSAAVCFSDRHRPVPGADRAHHGGHDLRG